MRALALGVLLVAAACSPSLPNAQLLNGLHGQLRFDSQQALDRVAVGGEASITVPRNPAVGHQVVGELWSAAALSGVSWPRGISGTLTEGAEQLELRVRCDQAGTFNVGVTISDSSRGVRSDSVSITCIAPTGLAVTLDRGAGSTKYLLGGVIDGWLVAVDDRAQELSGELQVDTGPLEGAITPLPETLPGAFRFRALHVAKGVELAAANVTASVPLEIVDPPSWAPVITLERQALEPNGTLFTVTADATSNEGQLLFGLDGCSFTALRGDVKTTLSGFGSCRFTTVELDASATTAVLSQADRVCVEVQGRSTCAQIGR